MNKTILATMIGLAVLTGCERSDNNNSAEIVVPPSEGEAFNSPYTVFFQGLGEGSLSGSDIEFTLEGLTTDIETLSITGATQVASHAARDGSDKTKLTFTTDTGSFILTRTDASSDLAIPLEMVVFTTGYFTGGSRVVIPAEVDMPEGSALFGTVTLSPQVVDDSGESTTAATGSTESVATGDDGVVTEDIVIATPVPKEGDNNAEAVAGGTVNLDLPAGTTMSTTDSEGNVVPVSGPIEANVVYFSNEPTGSTDKSTDSVLLSFPGGLAPSTILDEDGNETSEDVSFVTAGFTAIEMRTESGELITNFDPAITLTFDIPAATTSSDGDPIVTGDEIPVWSYNEQVGQWKSEGVATIGEKNTETDTFKVPKEISHLSYFSVAYLEQNCDVTITLQDNATENYQSRILLTRDGGGWTSEFTESFGQVTLTSIPENAVGELYISKYRADQPISFIDSVVVNGESLTISEDSDGDRTLQGQNFCDLDGAVITLESVVEEDAELTLSLRSVCPDTPDVTAQPGLVNYYKVINGQNYAVGNMSFTTSAPQTVSLDPGTYFFEGFITAADAEQYASKTVTFGSGELSSQTLDFRLLNSCITTGGGGTPGPN